MLSKLSLLNFLVVCANTCLFVCEFVTPAMPVLPCNTRYACITCQSIKCVVCVCLWCIVSHLYLRVWKSVFFLDLWSTVTSNQITWYPMFPMVRLVPQPRMVLIQTGPCSVWWMLDWRGFLGVSWFETSVLFLNHVIPLNQLCIITELTLN